VNTVHKVADDRMGEENNEVSVSTSLALIGLRILWGGEQEGGRNNKEFENQQGRSPKM